MTPVLTALGAAWLLLTASIAHGTSESLYACDAQPPPGPAWALAHRSADMRLYQRTSIDTPPEVAVRVRWQASPQALYRLIWEYEHFADVIPNVERSLVLERTQHRVWVYQRLNYPAPVRDRHYVLESTDHPSDPATGHYRVEWRLSERFELPANNGAVPVAAFSGCWDILRSRGGLEAVYRITLVPGGLVPEWVARHAVHTYLIELMAALKAKLAARSATSGSDGND